MMMRRMVFCLLLPVFFATCVQKDETEAAGGENVAAENRSSPNDASASQALKLGDTLADYRAKTLDGGVWSLDSGRNKATLVNIWATWCIPCREETPELVKLHEQYAGRGVEVVGVSIDAPTQTKEIREFISEYKVPYTMVHDGDASIANRFQASVIPFTFLLDSKGKIVWMHSGTLTAGDEDLNQKLNATLGGA